MLLLIIIIIITINRLNLTLIIIDDTIVEFRYYNATTNRLLAKSNSLKFIKYQQNKSDNEMVACVITGK